MNYMEPAFPWDIFLMEQIAGAELSTVSISGVLTSLVPRQKQMLANVSPTRTAVAGWVWEVDTIFFMESKLFNG